MNPLKAIREKCLDCVCYQPSLVAACEIERCALWPFRMGTNPFRKKRSLSAEQKREFTQRMAKAKDAIS